MSKFLIVAFLFFLFPSDNYISAGNEKNGLKKIKEAEKLFIKYKYRNAINKYIEAEKVVKSGKNLSRLYIGLSKSYYALGLEAKSREVIRKIADLTIQIKVDESKLPRGYLKIYKEILAQIKKEKEESKIVKTEEKIKELKPEIIAKEIEKPEKQVIERPGKKKKKKKKFPAIIVVACAAALVSAILLLGKKRSTNNTTPPPVDTETPIANEIYNSIEWVNIPAGEFKMGDNFVEGTIDERPVHTVYLDSYNIAKYEMTFELYDKYCDAKNYSKPSDNGWGREKRPVIKITCKSAKAFCDWMSEKTGKNIHLPTEAQWEKAARNTDQRKYPWGNGDPSCNKCNYNYCMGTTVSVGSYFPGAYGLYDMAGNVYEFCSDWYDEKYYSYSTYKNPLGPESGSHRVTRGGDYKSIDNNVRAANRWRILDNQIEPDTGFRVCED